MGGLPPEVLDFLAQTMARICEDPYDRLFSMAMRDAGDSALKQVSERK